MKYYSIWPESLEPKQTFFSVSNMLKFHVFEFGALEFLRCQWKKNKIQGALLLFLLGVLMASISRLSIGVYITKVVSNLSDLVVTLEGKLMHFCSLVPVSTLKLHGLTSHGAFGKPYQKFHSNLECFLLLPRFT